jgi:hypothetical protein
MPLQPDPSEQDQDPARGVNRRMAGRAAVTEPGRSGSDARVDAESAASFPASDPPSDWAGADERPTRRAGQGMA